MKPFRDIILQEVADVLDRVDDEGTERFLRELRRAKRIYISGVGRSGLVVKAFGQRLMHLGYRVHLADEITAPAIARGDILVACSGSGRTMLTLYMAKKARSVSARVTAITADVRSPLSRNADLIVPIPVEGGRRRSASRQPIRSVFEQALFLYFDSIILTLMQRLRIPGRRIEKRHANLE